MHSFVLAPRQFYVRGGSGWITAMQVCAGRQAQQGSSVEAAWKQRGSNRCFGKTSCWRQMLPGPNERRRIPNRSTKGRVVCTPQKLADTASVLVINRKKIEGLVCCLISNFRWEIILCTACGIACCRNCFQPCLSQGNKKSPDIQPSGVLWHGQAQQAVTSSNATIVLLRQMAPLCHSATHLAAR